MGKKIDNIFEKIDLNLQEIKEGKEQDVKKILNDIKKLENRIDEIVQDEKVERFENILDKELVSTFFHNRDNKMEKCRDNKMEKYEKYLTWVANKNHYIAKNFKTNILIKMEDNLQLMKYEEQRKEWGNEHTLSRIHEVETMIHMYGESEIKNEKLFEDWNSTKNKFLTHFSMPSEKTYKKIYNITSNILTTLKKICTEKTPIKKSTIEYQQIQLMKIPNEYPTISGYQPQADKDEEQNLKNFLQWSKSIIAISKKIIKNKRKENENVPPVPQIFLQKFPYVWSDLSGCLNSFQGTIVLATFF